MAGNAMAQYRGLCGRLRSGRRRLLHPSPPPRNPDGPYGSCACVRTTRLICLQYPQQSVHGQLTGVCVSVTLAEEDAVLDCRGKVSHETR
jgi:hypothetical protein